MPDAFRIRWDRAAVQRAVTALGARVLPVVGDLILDDAKRMVPIDTGDLRDDLDVAVEVGKRRVAVGSRLKYARHVELGTSRMAAQPYLRPALYRKRSL